jgi:hypothetical protein
MAPVAAAVLPHPPLLVPELAGTGAPELAPLRAACHEALAAVAAAADLAILVGTGAVWAVPTPSARGSFHPYGADLEVALPALTDLDLPDLPPPARLTELPLSLSIAAHLLATLDQPPTCLAAATVPATLGSSAAATIGHTLAAAGQRAAIADWGPLPGAQAGPARGSSDRARPAGRVGLVVLGDLSACRTDRAPGAFRPEAADFDASVADAFRIGAPQRLLDLDPGQADDLLVSGRVALQVMAGAFQQTGCAVPADIPGGTGPELRGRVLYEDAPYGVGYLVALLTAP